MFEHLYRSLAASGKLAILTMNGAPVHPPNAKKCFHDLISPHFENDLLFNGMSYVTATECESVARSVGFDLSYSDTPTETGRWKSLEKFLQFWSGVSGEYQVSSLGQSAGPVQRAVRRRAYQHRYTFYIIIHKIVSDLTHPKM